MKFIHCADIHLGSRMDSRLPADKALTRRAEVRKSFLSMLDYARQQDISLIVMAGDVFDGDTPAISDKEFFYDAVKAHADIDFLYLRGNHDSQGAYKNDSIENLKTFSDSLTHYDRGDVHFYGIELTAQNHTDFYDSLSLPESGKNILILHGQTGSSQGEGLISLPLLRGKGIDYLALGHIHSFKTDNLDERGIYAYSGCLEGRGFDETGEKGFLVVDTSDMRPEFVPCAARTIHEIEVPLDDTHSVYEALTAVRDKTALPKKDIVHVSLTGETDYDTDTLVNDALSQLTPNFFFASVKNKSSRRIDISLYKDEISLRGEFVRTVTQSPDYSDEEKRLILETGLKALAGREITV